MTLNELIEHLEKFKEYHGNKQVEVKVVKEDTKDNMVFSQSSNETIKIY